MAERLELAFRVIVLSYSSELSLRGIVPSYRSELSFGVSFGVIRGT